MDSGDLTKEKPRRRWLPVVLAIVVGVSLSSGFAWIARSNVKATDEAELRERATANIVAIESAFLSQIQLLESFVAFFDASDSVSRREFSEFAEHLLANYTSVKALEWAPIIRGEQRDPFEKAAGYEITEKLDEGIVRATDRENYVVVHYMEPHEGNERAMGFDLYSESVRREALERASRSGELTSTGPIRLVQDANSVSVLLVKEVPARSDWMPGAAERSGAGYIVGVLQIEDVVRKQIARLNLNMTGLRLFLLDKSDPREHLLLCDFDPDAEAGSLPATNGSREAIDYPESARLTDVAFPFGGRSWHAFMIPTGPVTTAGASAIPAALFVLGLWITGMVVLYLHRLSSFNTRLATEVQDRRAIQLELLKSQKELEDRVAERTRQLEEAQMSLIETEKLKTVGRMAAGVAHEVKNPLAIIRFGVEYLGRKGPGGDAHTGQVLEDVTDAVDRADRIVGELLSYASPRSVTTEAADINEILREAERLAAHEARRKGVNLHISCDPSVPKLELDPQKLVQVFVNLMSNAIHATPTSGRVEATIRRGRPEAGSAPSPLPNGAGESGPCGAVICEIVDTGQGIDPDNLRRAFEPFFTTKDTGTGLGLAVARHIVEMLGGTMVLENHEGGGARARVVFKL